MKRCILAVFVVLTLSHLGCGKDNPCSSGGLEKVDRPGGTFKDLGLPDGASACIAVDTPDDPRVAYAIQDEAEGVRRFTSFMTGKGYKDLPLSAELKKERFEQAVAGRGGTFVLFGRDGETKRYYGDIKNVPAGDVVIDLSSVDCAPDKVPGGMAHYCN